MFDCVNTCRWLAGEDPVEASAESWVRNRKRFKEVEEGAGPDIFAGWLLCRFHDVRARKLEATGATLRVLANGD